MMYKEEKKPLINRRYLWKIPFLQKYSPLRKVSKHFSEPIFGKEVYELISEAKIVFNISGGLKQFGNYKFNNRIFEALGVGSFMLSDKGIYPSYMKEGIHFDVYSNFKELTDKIQYYLKNNIERESMAREGNRMIASRYSKDIQWQEFTKIINEIKNEKA